MNRKQIKQSGNGGGFMDWASGANSRNHLLLTRFSE